VRHRRRTNGRGGADQQAGKARDGFVGGARWGSWGFLHTCSITISVESIHRTYGMLPATCYVLRARTCRTTAQPIRPPIREMKQGGDMSALTAFSRPPVRPFFSGGPTPCVVPALPLLDCKLQPRTGIRWDNQTPFSHAPGCSRSLGRVIQLSIPVRQRNIHKLVGPKVG
jgi:hypothetical protein